MENYCLQENEALLYKTKLYGGIEVLLTNINLILIKTTKVKEGKKIFAKEREETDVTVFPVCDIKLYKDIPQIKVKDSSVEIFFATSEEKLDFPSKIEAHKFVHIAYELLTGKSLATRGAEKVKKAISLVDDTLGFNTIGTVRNVMENGITGSLMGKIGKKIKNNKISAVIDSVDKVKDVLETATSIVPIHNTEQ